MIRLKNNIKGITMQRFYDFCVQRISLVNFRFLMLALVGGGSFMLLISCTQTSKSSENQKKDKVEKGGLHKVRYTRPKIPLMMTSPAQRAFYYVNHYWDGYSLVDTAFIRSNETEQLYADFIGALEYVNTKESSVALKQMMVHMEADSIAYAYFCLLGEKYLYLPNSPMRNENYYISVLKQMLTSTRLTGLDKIRLADRLEQALKNRRGMKAADFSYVTPRGKVGRMSRVKADYTLLFFYDPDCENCREYEQILSEMPAFVEMQKKGLLRVLAVYLDEDGDAWLLNSSKMPRDWIVAWNKQGDIRNKTLYEILATPTMYLLDKQKKVLLKDVSMEKLIHYLAKSYQSTSPLKEKASDDKK